MAYGPSYSIYVSTGEGDDITKILERVENIDALMNQLADDVVLPILERHYDESGIKHGGIYGGRHVDLLKPAITKRGSFGNIVKFAGNTLTVGISYEQVYYAKWVLEGRGAVSAKNKKMLHWIDPDTGKDRFAKRVGPAPPHPVYYLMGSELQEIEAHLNVLLQGE